MLDDLNPQGPLETVLANRITTLTWQLNRAPRFQAAVVTFMNDDWSIKPSDPEKLLGKTVQRDFAHNHVLEKLQTYAQRIENNLYKTIEKLEVFQKNRINRAEFQKNRKNSENFQKNQKNSKKTEKNQKISQKTQPEIQPEPAPMSSRAEKCEAKRSVLQSRELFLEHREAIPINKTPQNKPNSYANGVPCPNQSTNYEPPTTNCFPDY